MPLALSRAGEPYKKINPLHQKAAHSSEKRQLLPLNQNRPGFQQKVKIYNLEAKHGMLQDFFYQSIPPAQTRALSALRVRCPWRKGWVQPHDEVRSRAAAGAELQPHGPQPHQGKAPRGSPRWGRSRSPSLPPAVTAPARKNLLCKNSQTFQEHMPEWVGN